MDDNQAIRRIRGGDTEAFSLLVERYHRKLLHFIYRLVGDESVAEDLGQEVFISVYRRLPQFDIDKGVPFSAWLFIAARNRCASHLRAAGRRRFVDLEQIAELPSGGVSAEEEILKRERSESLRNSLNLLPEPYRTTLLRSLRGETLGEIASVEGLAYGTVKSRLFRAKQRVRTFLGKMHEGEFCE